MKEQNFAAKMSFIIKSTNNDADSSRISMVQMLKSLTGKVKMITIKTNGDFKGRSFVHHFSFTDTVKPDGKNVDLKVLTQSGGELEELPVPKKKGVGFVYIVKSTAIISDAKDGSQHKVGDGLMLKENTSYFLNGNKITKEDFDKLNPNKISDMKIDRNSQAIQITTRQ